MIFLGGDCDTVPLDAHGPRAIAAGDEVIWRTWLGLIAVFLVSDLHAQGRSYGVTAHLILASGDGVAQSSCLQSNYFGGFGIRVAAPIRGNRTTLQIAGRGYLVGVGSSCVDGFPPEQGVFVQDDRVNLQSTSFVTTDIRLATQFNSRATFAAGVGAAWHEGPSLPYLVVAMSLPLVHRTDLLLSFDAEIQFLRVTSARYRRTYQNYSLVSEEPLGRVHQGSLALQLGMHIGAPF